MSNRITYRTALEIVYHEAIVRQAYKDSVGVWTWSVGLTAATGHDVLRYKDNPQTMEHCLAIFVWALEKYANEVRKRFGNFPLTEAQFAAALSFHWNTGRISSASWVTMFMAGRMADAEKSFLSWNKPKEIEERRKAEADLLFRGKWSANGTVTEYTRVNPSTYAPVWSSGKKVNIETPLRAAMGDEQPVDEPEPTPEPAPVLPRTRTIVMDEIQALIAEYATLKE